MCIHDYISSTTVYSFIHIFPLSLYSTTKVALTMTQEETTNQSQASTTAASTVSSSRPSTAGNPNYATPRLAYLSDRLSKAETDISTSNGMTEKEIGLKWADIYSLRAALHREKNPTYPECIAQYKKDHPPKSSNVTMNQSTNQKRSSKQELQEQDQEEQEDSDEDDFGSRYF